MNKQEKTITVWTCDGCDKEFDTQEKCTRHESSCTHRADALRWLEENPRRYQIGDYVSVYDTVMGRPAGYGFISDVKVHKHKGCWCRHYRVTPKVDMHFFGGGWRCDYDKATANHVFEFALHLHSEADVIRYHLEELLNKHRYNDPYNYTVICNKEPFVFDIIASYYLEVSE